MYLPVVSRASLGFFFHLNCELFVLLGGNERFSHHSFHFAIMEDEGFDLPR
jgi:hypothetical protein